MVLESHTPCTHLTFLPFSQQSLTYELLPSCGELVESQIPHKSKNIKGTFKALINLFINNYKVMGCLYYNIYFNFMH